MPPEDPTGSTEPAEPTSDPVEPAAEPTEPTSTEPELPEYQNILESLPQSLHDIVKPEIEKYTESQKARLEEIQAQYDPWKPIAEQYELTDAQKRLEFSQAFEKDPVRVYNDLHKYLSDNGLLPADPAAPEEPPDETDDENYEDEIDDPVLKAMSDKLNSTQEAVAKLVEGLQNQQRSQQENQLRTELDSYVKQVDEAHPGVPRNYLLRAIADGEDGMQAAKAYLDDVESKVAEKLKAADDAPSVIGGGGAPPSTKVEGSLSDRNTRKELAMQIMAQNAQASK